MSCKFRYLFVLASLAVVVLMPSCSINKLMTSKVTYQSVRTTFAQPDKDHPIPEEAEIVVTYMISDDGELNAIVFNRTDEIMTIDQTKSFFVNSDGVSTMYYDPVVRTISKTDTQSSSSGSSINLGSVASVFGIGGKFGTLLGGIGVGGGSTTGSSVTEVVRVADMPEVSLAPHSQAAMSKTYTIGGIGTDAELMGTSLDLKHENSYCKFSVCISYSIDGGKNFKKIVTYFYANSSVVVPVSGSEDVNGALRNIYNLKPDWINEPFWVMCFKRRYEDSYHSSNQTIVNGVIFDFQ